MAQSLQGPAAPASFMEAGGLQAKDHGSSCCSWTPPSTCLLFFFGTPPHTYPSSRSTPPPHPPNPRQCFPVLCDFLQGHWSPDLTSPKKERVPLTPLTKPSSRLPWLPDKKGPLRGGGEAAISQGLSDPLPPVRGSLAFPGEAWKDSPSLGSV